VAEIGRTRLPSLGTRGQGWVWLQSLLMFLVVLLGSLGPTWPDSIEALLLVAGTLVFLAGTAQVGLGVLAVGVSFGVFLRPTPGAPLRTTGLLSRARHPIYGGWMLAALGWALVFSPWSLVPAGLLLLELDGKRRVEERWLVAFYPEYVAYAQRVRRLYLVVP